MGILLCEQNFREVWRRNENVRAEFCQMLRTHTHAAQLVVRISIYLNRVRTDPGKPGKYWNLIIKIPGLEYTGISSKVLENTGI